MKECFIPKRFNGKSSGLLSHIERILNDYARDGYDLTVRQIHYALVSKNIIKNTVKQYKSLVALVNDARMAGVLDWRTVVDRGRNAYRPENWTSVGAMARDMAASFKIDKWADQPVYLEVMVEKQALEGVLLPACSRLDVTFTANKGYSSASAFYRAGKRFARRASEGKRLVVLYLGDHDPSGMDMTRDIMERVPLLGGSPCQSGFPAMPLNMEIQRLALNINQVREFKLPPNPAKQTDSRCAGYVSEFGPESWELDAIEPRALDALVTDAVAKLRDEVLWAAACAREELQRKALTKFAKRFDKKPRKK